MLGGGFTGAPDVADAPAERALVAEDPRRQRPVDHDVVGACVARPEAASKQDRNINSAEEVGCDSIEANEVPKLAAFDDVVIDWLRRWGHAFCLEHCGQFGPGIHE